MKRIHSIELKHFKAFKDSEPIELGGRNLLIYGPNGSGKSSIYWALYTFLQSSQKSTEEVQKYFDPLSTETLVNIDMPEDARSSIVLGIVEDIDLLNWVPIKIDLDSHETVTSDWVKTNLASDFITYRVLFRFYHFTNSEEVDLWPVFQREILPFCSSLLSDNLADIWAVLNNNNPRDEVQSKKARGNVAVRIYDKYDKRLEDFNVSLEETLESIHKAAQEFYNEHFALDSEKALLITLTLKQKTSYDRNKYVLIVPKIGLHIRYDGKPISRPHSFLNEAKLTQIALSIRFGSTKANLQDAPMKLLVLDDLLISLDMCNRMQVIKVILSDEDFAGYQKIIMTHDRGFYNEIRRSIGIDHCNWSFQKINCINGGEPEITSDKDDLLLAEECLAQNRLEDAAVSLRRAAESNLKRFGENKLGIVFDGGEFKSLSERLKEAKHKMEMRSIKKIRNLISKECIDEETIAQLIMIDEAAIISRESLDASSKGKLRHYGIILCSLLTEILKENREALEIIDQIAETKDRILNPGAHSGEPVLYISEVESALALIRRLSAIANET